jgi:methanogenic corrinoid protein MtbC1
LFQEKRDEAIPTFTVFSKLKPERDANHCAADGRVLLSNGFLLTPKLQSLPNRILLMIEPVANAYREAILDADRDRALAVVDGALQMGIAPEQIVAKVVVSTIEAIFQSVTANFELCLAQHYIASQISSEVVETMVPRFRKNPEPIGRVIIGTSHGDVHGLGKNIVAGFLKTQMVNVFDLGLNVPAERFVDEAVKHDAEVIAISSMMVHTARGHKGCLRVRRLLRERTLETKIKIIVGGAPFNYDENLYRVIGADESAWNALAAIPAVRRLIQEVRGR